MNKLSPSQHMAARAIMNAVRPQYADLGSNFASTYNVKHALDFDFGYPNRGSEIPFRLIYDMWRRNGFAKGLTVKTAGKTWQEAPVLLEYEDQHDETGLEREIKRKFAKLRFWQQMQETDMRGMVGKYSAVLLRVRDGKRWNEPVETVTGGIDGLVDVIPAWEEQLTPSAWDTDPASETYGLPTMYHYNEQNVDAETGKFRAFEVHPDRVYIWSRDNTTFGESQLEACYNALMDVEKIRGAGGEGFWKNAKSQPVLQASPDVNFTDLAAMLGVEMDGLADALDDVVAKWSKGFDVSLVLQGMEAKTLTVTLPQPAEFHNVAIQEIAAAWPIPQKILVGMQTGERASTEDQREWGQINMSRRSNLVVPNIMGIIERLVEWRILPQRDWYLDWADLTAPTLAEKLEDVAKMADVNQKMAAIGPVFTQDEMRDIADYDELVGDEFVSEIPEDGESDGSGDDSRQEDV